MSTIGERIKIRREQKGLSLSALAGAAGISKSYLHDLENSGDANPSAEILYDIAQSLDTTVGFLLGRRRNPLEQEGQGQPLEIPAELEEFARKAKIPDDDKRRLACIKYRGQRPKTARDWEYLYETIRRVSESNG